MTSRKALAARLEHEIRPLLSSRGWDFVDGVWTEVGGYNCCGCGAYDDILDHAIAIVRGER